MQNWNTAVYGGDPEEVGEDEVEYGDELAREEGNLKPTSYTFQELPGAPRAEKVLSLLHSHRSHSSWEGRGLGPVSSFVAALEQCARDRLGDLDEEQIRSLPGYVQTPALPGYLAPDWDIFLPDTQRSADSWRASRIRALDEGGSPTRAERGNPRGR